MAAAAVAVGAVEGVEVVDAGVAVGGTGPANWSDVDCNSDTGLPYSMLCKTAPADETLAAVYPMGSDALAAAASSLGASGAVNFSTRLGWVFTWFWMFWMSVLIWLLIELAMLACVPVGVPVVLPVCRMFVTCAQLFVCENRWLAREVKAACWTAMGAESSVGYCEMVAEDCP